MEISGHLKQFFEKILNNLTVMQWRRCCSCLLSAKVELFEDITKKGTRITLHNALFLTKARNVPRLIFFPQSGDLFF